MADKEKKSESQQVSGAKGGSPAGRVSDAQRFRYIGFEVFPGKPKDLFKSDAERQQYIDRDRAARSARHDNPPSNRRRVRPASDRAA